MTASARILRVSAAFLASNLTRAAIAFGLTLVLGRGLGPAVFGRWILCTTWASFVTVIADLGFGMLLTRDGARPDAAAGRLVASALVLRLAVTVPAAIALSFAAAWVTNDPDAIGGLRLAGVLGVAGAAYGCFGAMLRSQPRWLPAVLGIETAWLAAQLAGSWWIASGASMPSAVRWLEGVGWRAAVDGPDSRVRALLVIAIAVQLAQIATAVVLWRPVFGDRGTVRGPREPLLATARRALPFALSGIVANLQSRVAPLMLGALSTDGELGLFAAASRFGRFARLAPQAIFAGALPVLSHEYLRDRAEAARVSRTLGRWLLVAASAAAVACVLFARPVLQLIYGATFVTAAPALMWVAAGLIPALGNSARKVALYAAGAETVAMRWSVVALIVQVAIAAAFIPFLGATGAAIAVAVGEGAIWFPLQRAESTAHRPAASPYQHVPGDDMPLSASAGS